MKTYIHRIVAEIRPDSSVSQTISQHECIRKDKMHSLLAAVQVVQQSTQQPKQFLIGVRGNHRVETEEKTVVVGVSGLKEAQTGWKTRFCLAPYGKLREGICCIDEDGAPKRPLRRGRSRLLFGGRHQR